MDDVAKVQVAWQHVRERIDDRAGAALFNFSGLERRLPLMSDEIEYCDDELAPALHWDRLVELGRRHLGGESGRDDIAVMNRLTAALFASILATVEPGQVVVGFSARYSHPVVQRSVLRAGATFVDTSELDDLRRVLAETPDVGLLVLTRLTVSYELLEVRTMEAAIKLARERGIRIVVDDAGGARVGPAVLRQPKTLELDVDLGATGLDKYGVIGPRLGLLGGRSELVAQARALAVELGLEARPMLYGAVVRTLEQYRPERVRALVASTRAVGAELRQLLGDERVWETEVIVQLRGEDILDVAMERSGITAPPIVPYEATAALAMLLLRDHGILTVHFGGLPPGTSALMLKFLPPETVENFGGPSAVAKAVDSALSALAELMPNRSSLRRLLLEKGL